MSDAGPGLDELYREVILDHHRSPRNRRQLADATVVRRGINPLCGDEIEVGLRIDRDRIEELAFDGRGCSISQASASMMTEALAGRTLEEVGEAIDAFRRLMSGDGAVDEARLGDLAALSGVRKFPVRVKCATLAWHTLAEALSELRRV